MNSGILLEWESKKMWTLLSTNQILRKELQEGILYIYIKEIINSLSNKHLWSENIWIIKCMWLTHVLILDFIHIW